VNAKSAHWTLKLPDSCHAWLNGRTVEEVECIVSDFAGMSRGKAMPALKFSRADRMYLPGSIFYQTITGEYVDLEDMPEQWTESDLVMVPDYSTATAVPWSADVTIQVVHDATFQGQGLGTGCCARARVLSHQAQYRPWPANRTTHRSNRATRNRASGLQHERG